MCTAVGYNPNPANPIDVLHLEWHKQHAQGKSTSSYQGSVPPGGFQVVLRGIRWNPSPSGDKVEP